MAKLNFNLKNHLKPTLNSIKKVLSSRKDREVAIIPTLRIHYEAIVYIRINYEAKFLSRKKKMKFDKLFKRKSPTSLMLGKELIRIINKFGPYKPKENICVLYNCIKMLNDKDLSGIAKDYSIDLYSKYLEHLRLKYPFVCDSI